MAATLQQVLCQLQPLRGRDNRELFVTPEATQDALSNLLHAAYAESTWSARAALWLRLRRYADLHGYQVTPSTAVLFVLATAVAPASMSTYAGHLAGIFRDSGVEYAPLRVLIRALKGVGAAIPETQATPMAQEHLYAHVGWLVERARTPADYGLVAALIVSWKTASRWDETFRLTHDHVLSVAADEVVIDWARLPKNLRRSPHRTCRFAVVRGPLTALLAHCLQRLGDFEQLTRVDTAGIEAHFRTSPQQHLRVYSAHSLKRGAATVLFEWMAAYPAMVPDVLVSRLLKHANATETIPKDTVRYVSRSLTLARALQTQLLTRLL